MASEDKVKVLGFWASPYTLRVLIGLEEKGIKYESVVESTIIVEYIDEVWSNGPTFLPSDLYDRAMVPFWVDFIDKKLLVAGKCIIKSKGAEQEEGKRQVIASLAILEETLKGKDYFGGNTFGMVDITFAPLICWFHTYEILGDFKIIFENKFPNIFSWMKKCMERESIKKLFPQQEKVLQMVMQFTKRSSILEA
ncbi:hypothetical protein SUGI_0342200 [Cryptomeria japonica]|nr:hypothetical protein SUGI_0342200 [Cryptomeria japonica]